MSEVLRVHAIIMARQSMALFLVLMFCAMSCLPMVNANPNRNVDVVVGLAKWNVRPIYNRGSGWRNCNRF